MALYNKIILLAIISILLTSCATTTPPRSGLSADIPPLSPSLGRIYFCGGTVQLKGGIFYTPPPVPMTEGGDVYINNKNIGFFNDKECIVSDVLPGEYEFKWVTKLGDFDVKHTLSQQSRLIITQNTTKYFQAHKVQGETPQGGLFGAAGVLVGSMGDQKIFQAYFQDVYQDGDSILKDKRIIEYSDLSKKIKPIQSSSNTNIDAQLDQGTNQKTSSVSDQLKKLKQLQRDGLITKEDYNKAKQNVLDKL